MPLTYDTREPLVIPDEGWNDDGQLLLLVQGGRYGGQWLMSAAPLDLEHGPGDEVGAIWTALDYRPAMAVDTAVVWVNDACARAGHSVLAVMNLNHLYDADSAPYFAAVQFVIGKGRVKYTVMSPNGWTGPSYDAPDAEAAAVMARLAGHDIVDIQGNLLVVEDEPPIELAPVTDEGGDYATKGQR